MVAAAWVWGGAAHPALTPPSIRVELARERLQPLGSNPQCAIPFLLMVALWRSRWRQ